jgi:hypothetical protein
MTKLVKRCALTKTSTGSSCCPQSVNCFYGKVGKNAALSQMSILTVGSSPDRSRVWDYVLPLANIPSWRRTDNWTLDNPATGHIFGRRADVANPSGRGRWVPTVTELIFVRAQCFTNFAIKEFTLGGHQCNWIHKSNLRLVDMELDPVVCPQA